MCRRRRKYGCHNNDMFKCENCGDKDNEIKKCPHCGIKTSAQVHLIMSFVVTIGGVGYVMKDFQITMKDIMSIIGLDPVQVHILTIAEEVSITTHLIL